MSRAGFPIVWTAEPVAQLRLLWAAGQTATQIAGEMGRGITRNSVLGKVHRMGFPRRLQPKNNTPAKPRKPRPSRAAQPTRSHGLVIPKFAAAPLPVAPTMPFSRRLTVLELSATACRWPTDTDEVGHRHLFCGVDAPHQPYCRFHARLSYQQSKAARVVHG